MSSFSVKMMAGSLPPFNGSNGFTTASVKPLTLPLQVRVKQLQKIEASEKKSVNISRRDLALFLTAASFSAVTLSSPKPAEAVMSRAEIKKTMLEKFKILREKVGLLKSETEEKERIELSKPDTKKNEKIPSPAPLIAEKKLPVPPGTLPNLQNDKKIVVEAAPLP